MSVNLNTEYEKLTKEIYQAINDNENIKNINIQHNIRIEGKSGCKHQIDVYWEFEMMGEIHKVAIECKNYSKEVSVGKIRDFFGVLHDIGDIKGIFVTKIGYQSGAIKYADYYNISLKEMRFPTEKDWEGKIKDIVLNLHVFSINIKERKPELDFDWLKENTNYKEGDNISFGAMMDEIIIEGLQDGRTTLYDFENKLPHEWKNEIDKEHIFEFTNTFLIMPNQEKFKLNKLSYVYDVISDNFETTLEGEAIAKAILKDIKSKKIKFYNKKNQIRDVG